MHIKIQWHGNTVEIESATSADVVASANAIGEAIAKERASSGSGPERTIAKILQAVQVAARKPASGRLN